MIVLYQFPWSPYCLVQRRILEASRTRFRIVNIPTGDRTVIWRLTRERYYQVPVVKDGRQVVFETEGDSQVVAKYLDSRLKLGLFPREWEGVQDLLWRYFENDVEGVGFRLNDIHWRDFVTASDRCAFVRHKERRFGRGCLDQWRTEEPQLLARLESLLLPAEQMLMTRPFLLGPRPLFVDFAHVQLGGWYTRMSKWRISLPA
jgi:glutathione S-transferase